MLFAYSQCSKAKDQEYGSFSMKDIDMSGLGPVCP